MMRICSTFAARSHGAAVAAAQHCVVRCAHTEANHANTSAHRKILCSDDLNKLSFVDAVCDAPKTWDNPIGHPVWEIRDANRVAINHKPCSGALDAIAFTSVKTCRWLFDTLSFFRFGNVTERKIVNRCLFLETVAGVPGMVGGMIRHMNSLRGMRRDNGWIHTLLEEAENERMHLLTFMDIRKPGLVFRGSILLTQAVMFNLLFVMYLLSPRLVHRFVGYLEEEAVRTYSHIIDLIDEGKLPEFSSAVAPQIAREYWRLPDDATYRDMFNVIRADEAGHRLVNHTFADMHQRHMKAATNPFINRLHSEPGDVAVKGAVYNGVPRL